VETRAARAPWTDLSKATPEQLIARMPQSPIASHSEPRLLTPGWVLLIIAALACVVLRARGVGHLLVWDEAMALCTARSFVAGGQDEFSLWFWRHPPLFSVLTLGLSPTAPGFAERVEWLAIGIACLNLLLLFRLNAALFGATTAGWSALLLATLPGAVFFDTWVKTDHTVTTFGLLALLALHHRRIACAGLGLGLALLSKETAAFYCLTAFLVFAPGALRQPGGWRRLALLVLWPAVVAGWWYLLFAGRAGGEVRLSLAGLLESLRFAAGDQSGWSASWSFYLRQLPDLLGWHGLGLTVAGVGALLVARLKPGLAAPADGPGWSTQGGAAKAGSDGGEDIVHGGRAGAPSQDASPSESGRGLPRSRALRTLARFCDSKDGTTLHAWPLVLLAVSYVPLSLLPNKVPWIAICLLPAFAALQAVGLCELWRLTLGRLVLPRFVTLALGATAAGALLVAGWLGWDYDALLQRLAPGQQRGAAMSRQTAERARQLVRPGDRVLLSSFHYWAGLPPGQPCAVFTYYFSAGTNVNVLRRPHTARGPELLEDVLKHRLDWAILSPPPGARADEVFKLFAGRHALPASQLQGAWIFDTRGLHHRGGDAPARVE
jgi:hypothetical protein